MYVVKNYCRPNGQSPVSDFRNTLEKHDRAVIDAKLRKLEDCGLELLRTKMLQVIKGEDRDFYEVVAGDFRIATCFHRHESKFVLLHGWMKKGRTSPGDISHARMLLREHLNEGG